METKDMLQNLIRYSQVLYSDGILYESGAQNIATPDRRNLILKDIKLIKDIAAEIEKHFLNNSQG
jgi:hypothetical protein